jgi:hypothetical protein
VVAVSLSSWLSFCLHSEVSSCRRAVVKNYLELSVISFYFLGTPEITTSHSRLSTPN